MSLMGILGGHSAIKLLKLLRLTLKADFGTPMVSELPARRVRDRFGRKRAFLKTQVITRHLIAERPL
jgi:hypothetical protein